MTHDPDDDLRELLARKAAEVTPRGTYADLEAKLAAQRAGRHITGRHAILAVAAVLALVVGGLVVALATGGDEQQVDTAGGGSTTTATTGTTLAPTTIPAPAVTTTPEVTAATTTSTVPATTTTTAPPTTTTAVPGPAPLDDGAAVYLGGIGGLRLPAGIGAAERATGRTIDGDLDSGASVCSYGRFVDGPTDVWLMIENPDPTFTGTAHELGDAGRVVRVDVRGNGKVRAIGEGGFDRSVGIGSTEAEVLAAFPGATVEPHKYEPTGHYVTAHDTGEAEGAQLSILFETLDGRVTEFHTGDAASVALVEGCY